MAQITKASGMTIGQVAQRTGVNLETIRYYERIGLMPRPARTIGGQRSYSFDEVRRLMFVRRARELGFGLDSIRTLLALAEPHRRSCGEVKALAASHRDYVKEKIADLTRLELILAATVKKCRGNSSPECPVLDMLSPELDTLIHGGT